MDREAVDGEGLRDAVGKRADVLATIAGDAYRKPELVETLHVSRSTVDRALDDLLEAGLAESDGSTYRATTAGEVALAARRTYVDRTDAIADALPVLDALPDDAPVDPALLVGCTVHVPEPHAPESALAPVVDRLRTAERLRGFASVVKSSYVGIIHDQVVERDMTAEIVVQEGMRESLAGLARGREQLQDLLAADTVSVLETDRPLPFALWLTDGPDGPFAGLTVHDADSGGVVGVLVNEEPAAVEWCESLYATHRATAEPIPADAFDG
jgi:predicted transcriptional regulator